MAGGWSEDLYSSEIFSGTEWRAVTGRLPRPFIYFQNNMGTVDNRVFYFGKF